MTEKLIVNILDREIPQSTDTILLVRDKTVVRAPALHLLSNDERDGIDGGYPISEENIISSERRLRDIGGETMLESSSSGQPCRLMINTSTSLFGNFLSHNSNRVMIGVRGETGEVDSDLVTLLDINGKNRFIVGLRGGKLYVGYVDSLSRGVEVRSSNVVWESIGISKRFSIGVVISTQEVLPDSPRLFSFGKEIEIDLIANNFSPSENNVSWESLILASSPRTINTVLWSGGVSTSLSTTGVDSLYIEKPLISWESREYIDTIRVMEEYTRLGRKMNILDLSVSDIQSPIDPRVEWGGSESVREGFVHPGSMYSYGSGGSSSYKMYTNSSTFTKREQPFGQRLCYYDKMSDLPLIGDPSKRYFVAGMNCIWGWKQSGSSSSYQPVARFTGGESRLIQTNPRDWVIRDEATNGGLCKKDLSIGAVEVISFEKGGEEVASTIITMPPLWDEGSIGVEVTYFVEGSNEVTGGIELGVRMQRMAEQGYTPIGENSGSYSAMYDTIELHANRLVRKIYTRYILTDEAPRQYDDVARDSVLVNLKRVVGSGNDTYPSGVYILKVGFVYEETKSLVLNSFIVE